MPINIIQCGTKNGGGIRTVMDSYEEFFSSGDILLKTIYTHGDKKLKTVAFFIAALFKIFFGLLFSKVDIVHCHMSMRGSFFRKIIILLLVKMFNKKYIIHIHGSETKKFLNNSHKLIFEAYRFLLKKSDVVIVLSDSWLDYFKSICDSANIFVVKNSVNIPVVDAGEVSCGEILFLGEIGRRKGFYDIIDIWGKIEKSFPDINFMVCGGFEVGFDEKLIHQFKSINYMGWINKNQKNKILSARPIFILPSYNEGLPMSLIEAMSYGCPVVATNVGGIPELINNNVNGFMIDPGDKDKLLDIISVLIDDKILANRIGEVARQDIELNFSAEKTLKSVQDIYIKLVN